MRQTALVALAMLLTGCAVHGTAPPSIPSGPISPQFAGSHVLSPFPSAAAPLASRGWMSKEATSGAKLLYVSSYPACGGCVLIFEQKTGALVGLLSAGPLIKPQGLATDSSGNLYVTNENPDQNAVWIYPPGSIFPSNNLYDPGAPSNVVVGDDGTIYVSNSGPTAAIMVYSNGSTNPTSEMFDVSAAQGYGIAVDKRGNVYWGISTVSGFQIDKFKHGTVLPVNLGIILNDTPQSMAFDSDNRLVVSQPDIPSINIYKLPNTLVKQLGQTGAPVGIAFKGPHGLFVADRNTNQIEQYAYPAGNVLQTFAPPNFNPIGVAVYPQP
ncbi:MAG TPA: hypothetical protein VII69_09270 [Candidatus Eremiobacteraceae bacterium]